MEYRPLLVNNPFFVGSSTDRKPLYLKCGSSPAALDQIKPQMLYPIDPQPYGSVFIAQMANAILGFLDFERTGRAHRKDMGPRYHTKEPATIETSPQD